MCKGYSGTDTGLSKCRDDMASINHFQRNKNTWRQYTHLPGLPFAPSSDPPMILSVGNVEVGATGAP